MHRYYESHRKIPAIAAKFIQYQSNMLVGSCAKNWLRTRFKIYIGVDVIFRKLRILCYHNIADAPENADGRVLYVSQTQFVRHMWVLRKLGLRGVSLTEGLMRLRQGNVDDCVALTFDDGYKDNVTNALPVLNEFGFKATCYIVSDRIGQFNEWDSEQLNTRKALMNEKDIQTWLDSGLEIGSHTCTHPRLDQLDQASTLKELIESRESLKRVTGNEIAHFCYPYGRYQQSTPALVKSAGYSTGTVTRPGFVNRDSDPFLLSRIGISGESGFAKILAKLSFVL